MARPRLNGKPDFLRVGPRASTGTPKRYVDATCVASEIPVSGVRAPKPHVVAAVSGVAARLALRLLGRRAGASGPDRRREQDYPSRLARHHGRDRGADTRRDPGFRLVVPRLQSACGLSAGFRL